jgi:hypothetical protein
MGLQDHVWRCSCCGEERRGIPEALAFKAPANWLHLKKHEQLISKLSDDFCKIRRFGEATERYIRCVLPMQILGAGSGSKNFQFGVWMSVSEQSWEIYKRGHRNDRYETDGCFGYLANGVPEFTATYSLHADVEFESNGQRPTVWLHNADHPFVHAQHNGIEMRVLEKIFSLTHT